MGRKHIIWDWNGTLFHDIDAVVDATNEVFKPYGLCPLDPESYREVYTRPLWVAYERLLGRPLREGEWEELDRAFHDHYHRLMATCGLTDGALDTLADWAESGTQSLLSMWTHDRLVAKAGELGIEAFSNVRRDAVRDRSLRGGDPALSHEPFVWDNGLIEIPVDVGSPETITAEKYEHVYSRIIKQKRYERTFNLVMHSWSLLSRTDEADGSGGTGPDPETRLHEMCEHATKHGRASGYGDYLDRT